MDTCNNRIIIYWTRYIGWDNKLINYQVRETVTQNPYKPELLSPTDTSFILENVTNDSIYSFNVVAMSSDGYAYQILIVCM